MLFIWHSVFDSYYSQHSGWYVFSAKESKRYKALFISCSGFWLLLFKRRAHPVFVFFCCPGNIEKEMVISDARQRKQGRQKSVLPTVSSWRNLARRFTFGVSKCKVSILSSSEQDVVLSLASAFAPESSLLRGSMLCCPSSSLKGGSVWSSTSEDFSLMHIDSKGWSS